MTEYVIELTEEETELVMSYAKRHDITVEEAFKKALFEKIRKECE